jgi:hypothetical protein
MYLANEKHWARIPLDAKRSDGAMAHTFTAYKGTVHTWLTFVSDNGKASDSIYTGEIVVG